MTTAIEETNAPAPGSAEAARIGPFVPDSGPAWIQTLRRRALAHFEKQGFPTTALEDWKLLDIRPVTRTPFVPAAAGARVQVTEVAQLALAGLDGAMFVFVNGRYEPELSHRGTLPPDVVVQPLTQAATRGGDGKVIEQHLGKYADDGQHAFTALNTALFDEGLFVHVPRQRAVNQPIYLLNLTVPAAEPSMTQPRNLIVVDEQSQVVVVEDYVTLGAPGSETVTTFTNAVTEFVVGAGATASHYLLVRENKAALNFSTLDVQQGRNSNFDSHTVVTGGKLVRNNVHPVLAGENGDSVLNGLYVLDGTQVVDNHMRVEHAAAHCNSRQHYRGIMAGSARGMFRGRIIVHKGAQKTDAKQNNANLLLSDDASTQSDPQLEIYADDVKCTHGSYTGQIDADALFYLQARGIDRVTATALLVQAFAGESLERMKVEPIRVHYRRWLMTHLPKVQVQAG